MEGMSEKVKFESQTVTKNRLLNFALITSDSEGFGGKLTVGQTSSSYIFYEGRDVEKSKYWSSIFQNFFPFNFSLFL